MFGKNEIVGKKYFDNAKKDQLFVTSLFFTMQGEGPFRGEPAFFIRLAKCNLACSFCFPANTKIKMSIGDQKKIKDIVVGDDVVSWSEKDQSFVNGVVTKTFKQQTDQLIKIKLDRGKPTFCTLDHPFLVKNYGWCKANELAVGDIILQANSKDKTVKSIELIEKGTGQVWTNLAIGVNTELDVYNFEVENYHTYIANGNIVHNCDTFFDDGDWMSFDELENKIETSIDEFYANKNKKRPAFTYHSKESNVTKKMVLVVTGGEPTLQANLGPFLDKMSSVFDKTQIESNGILHQASIPKDTTIVISPKCAEKKGVSIKYLKPHPKNLEIADCLKFVMDADPNTPYYTVPDWAEEWTNETGKPIYVSPMNIYNDISADSKELRNNGSNRIEIAERSTVDEAVDFWEPGLLDLAALEKNHKYVANYCIEHGFIFNMQMHLFAGLA